MTPVVYRVCNAENGRFYIGSSADFKKRIDIHHMQLKRGKHHNVSMQSDYDLGHEFTSEVLFILETREEAYEYEQSTLDQFKDNPLIYNIGKSARGGDNLTNNPRRDEIVKSMASSLKARMSEMSVDERKIKFGKSGERNGMFGRTHTPEVRKFLSDNMRGRIPRSGFKLSEQQKAKLSAKAKLRIGEKNPFFGKRHSEATRNIISEKAMGRIPSNALPIIINGVWYSSYGDASRKLNIPIVTIRWRIISKNVKFREWKFA